MKVIDLLNKIANGEESDTITEFEFNKSIWNFFKLQDSKYCIDEWLLNHRRMGLIWKDIVIIPGLELFNFLTVIIYKGWMNKNV